MATGAPTAQRQAVPVRHRPNIEEMTPDQVETLRDAFAAMQQLSDDRGYRVYADIHGLPLPIGCSEAHGQPAFLPWHRAYLLRFEQALRDALRNTGSEHDVMLPWWDWTATRDIPAAYKEPTRADGRPNPLFSVAINPLALTEAERSDNEEVRRLSHIPETVREPGWSGSRLPAAAEIATALKYTEYEQFRANLDDYHGTVHGWVGGHMTVVPLAAFDPIFWAHHCMIDRLWRIWQGIHPDSSFPSSLRGKTMVPFNLTGGDVLDPTTLGYDYAISISQVRPGG